MFFFLSLFFFERTFESWTKFQLLSLDKCVTEPRVLESQPQIPALGAGRAPRVRDREPQRARSSRPPAALPPCSGIAAARSPSPGGLSHVCAVSCWKAAPRPHGLRARSLFTPIASQAHTCPHAGRPPRGLFCDGLVCLVPVFHYAVYTALISLDEFFTFCGPWFSVAVSYSLGAADHQVFVLT